MADEPVPGDESGAMVCPNGHSTSTADDYCPTCGTRVQPEATCPNGHPVVDPTAQFCNRCGSPLAGPMPAPTTPSARRSEKAAQHREAMIAISAVAVLTLAIMWFFESRSDGPRLEQQADLRSVACDEYLVTTCPTEESWSDFLDQVCVSLDTIDPEKSMPVDALVDTAESDLLAATRTLSPGLARSYDWPGMYTYVVTQRDRYC